MQIDDTVIEAATASDDYEVTAIFSPLMAEAIIATVDLQVLAVFVPSITESSNATDTEKGIAFYWHPRNTSKNLELRSVHDVLTERERVSDPTGSHDLLRSKR